MAKAPSPVSVTHSVTFTCALGHWECFIKAPPAPSPFFMLLSRQKNLPGESEIWDGDGDGEGGGVGPGVIAAVDAEYITIGR